MALSACGQHRVTHNQLVQLSPSTNEKATGRDQKKKLLNPDTLLKLNPCWFTNVSKVLQILPPPLGGPIEQNPPPMVLLALLASLFSLMGFVPLPSLHHAIRD